MGQVAHAEPAERPRIFVSDGLWRAVELPALPDEIDALTWSLWQPI